MKDAFVCVAGAESTDVSAVILTKEQLLTWSSKDLDKFVGNIIKMRELTYLEEKEIAKQRRYHPIHTPLFTASTVVDLSLMCALYSQID
jgi:hypothetical protein